MYHMVGFGSALHWLIYKNYNVYSTLHFITIEKILIESKSRSTSHSYWRFTILFQGRRIYLKRTWIRIKTIQIYNWDSTQTLKISMNTWETLFTKILQWKKVAEQGRRWPVIFFIIFLHSWNLQYREHKYQVGQRVM